MIDRVIITKEMDQFEFDNININNWSEEIYKDVDTFTGEMITYVNKYKIEIDSIYFVYYPTSQRMTRV